MRRKDKEIKDKFEIETIINRAEVCRIGLSDDNMPYVIPVNYGYRNNCLYIHSASEGKKIDIIKKNNNICFEIDLDHELSILQVPCKSSMMYRSVIGFGKAMVIENFKEKQEALDIIMNHYSPNSFPKYNEKLIKKLSIIKVKIENMSGKKSGY